MQPISDASSCFQLLATTVRDLSSRGRYPLGAFLKVELRRRTQNGFNEQQLGYPKFGDFLRAAKAAGYIEIRLSPGGDLEALPAQGPLNPNALVPGQRDPASSPPNQTRAVPSESGSIRIREDLWEAFNSFSRWAYDPSSDRAVRMPSDAPANQGLLPGAFTFSDLVEIPSGRDRILGWMRHFASLQPPPMRDLLANVLQGENGFYQFNQVVRTDRKLVWAWRQFNIRQVAAAITAWTAEKRVQPKGVIVPYERPSPLPWQLRAAPAAVREAIPPSVAPNTAPATMSASSALTPRLATLIDELIDELARLRGMLHVVSPRQ